MKAYKCDICGEYCDYSYNIYGNIMVRTKKKNFKKMKYINELCDSCFEDLQRYIQDKYFEYIDKN